MIKQHTWTSEAHDFTYAFTLRLAVTMDGTAATGVLMLGEGAAVEAFVGVGEQIAAVVAQIFLAVLVSAIEAYHQLNGAEFLADGGCLVSCLTCFRHLIFISQLSRLSIIASDSTLIPSPRR